MLLPVHPYYCRFTHSTRAQRERWNADREIQAILKEISRAAPKNSPDGTLRAKRLSALLSYGFDKDAI
jgi:hypothetical protein